MLLIAGKINYQLYPWRLKNTNELFLLNEKMAKLLWKLAVKLEKYQHESNSKISYIFHYVWNILYPSLFTRCIDFTQLNNWKWINFKFVNRLLVLQHYFNAKYFPQWKVWKFQCPKEVIIQMKHFSIYDTVLFSSNCIENFIFNMRKIELWKSIRVPAFIKKRHAFWITVLFCISLRIIEHVIFIIFRPFMVIIE